MRCRPAGSRLQPCSSSTASPGALPIEKNGGYVEARKIAGRRHRLAVDALRLLLSMAVYGIEAIVGLIGEQFHWIEVLFADVTNVGEG